MRKFSVRPAVTLRGREFRGLRGWAGKPFHPPLTDIPIGAYILAVIFDLISLIGGPSHSWARDFFRAATFSLIGGLVVSVFAALTGYWDWLKSSQRGTQARRTINTHAWTMICVTLLVIGDIIWRIANYSKRESTPPEIFILSLVIAALTSFGATYGGSLVFDYGFNVETGGDHPVWHTSEKDVFPGQH